MLNKTFINEISKFLNIYGSASFSGEANKEKIHPLSSKNTNNFFIERNKLTGEINLEISEVSGKKVETVDEKIQNVLISKMEVIDFLNTRGQQKFKEEKKLNSIETRIEFDRVQSVLEKYKKNVARFRLKRLLFLSGIKNETCEIFLVTTGIGDTKYLLINNLLH